MPVSFSPTATIDHPEHSPARRCGPPAGQRRRAVESRSCGSPTLPMALVMLFGKNSPAIQYSYLYQRRVRRLARAASSGARRIWCCRCARSVGCGLVPGRSSRGSSLAMPSYQGEGHSLYLFDDGVIITGSHCVVVEGKMFLCT